MRRKAYRQTLAAAALTTLVALGLAYLSRSSQGPPLEEAQRTVDLAKAELAQRQGIPQDSIQVIEVSPVDWPDTSLGCPQPGMVYAQVITPGYRILLSDGQREYQYHSDRGRRAVLCPEK